MTLPYPLLWLLTTAFRFFPWPTQPGLQAVGQPGADSPVFLTGNFALTAARLKRALRGLDGWLLVANSWGINVWCAAAGGHLTTHDAISALKTSGIAGRVAHRRVILPQLAVTGIEADQVRERAGWRVIWGPVDTRDLPAFLRGEENPKMRQVRFAPQQRLEMAVMWAAPLSLLASITLLFWPDGFLPLVAGIAALPHAGRCEQCAACIVQCPTDALFFETPDGERTPPETVRRYKLNLLGTRIHECSQYDFQQNS